MSEPVHQGGGSDYILHHLQHWQVGSGFWTFNLDTILVSWVLGLIFIGVFFIFSRFMKDQPPRGFQNFLEFLVEFIDNQVKSSYQGPSRMVAPLALTIFCWVVLFNVMDLLPVDLLPGVASLFGVERMRVVPSADLNTTVGMALSVILLLYVISLKHKGPVGTLKDILTHPFGAAMMPFNLMMHFVENGARIISLSLRLFGNMYAGELIFILIALAPAAIAPFLGFPWAVFHILVVLLQAFVFMVLTVIYFSLSAAEEH